MGEAGSQGSSEDGRTQEQQTLLDEEDAAKATLCCLLPPFPQSCHSHYLLYSPASSFKTTHTDFIKETKRMGTLWSFCLPRSSSQTDHAISHGRPLVWHCREIHWVPDAPKLQPLCGCMQMKQAGELRLCNQMHAHDKKTASMGVVWTFSNNSVSSY